ncbi:MAG: hypothetical protein RSE00_01135 [Clostridia bacterium]
MNKKSSEKRLKGSGILVVVFSAIAFTIYVMSTYAQQEHYAILQNKYEKDIVKQYETSTEDLEKFYEDTKTFQNINPNMNNSDNINKNPTSNKLDKLR